jgi:hypothetical protein
LGWFDGSIGNSGGYNLSLDIDGAQGLSGVNTFTGDITIGSGALLQINATTALGVGNNVIMNGGALGVMSNAMIVQPIETVSGTTSYLNTNGGTVVVAELVGYGNLEIAGGGTVVFLDKTGFHGTLSNDGYTTSIVSPTTSVTTNTPLVAEDLSGWVNVESGWTLTLTGTKATPAVITLADGSTLTSTTAAVDAAILSLGNSDVVSAVIGADATVSVRGTGSDITGNTDAGSNIMLPSGSSLLASGTNASNLIGTGTLASDTTAGLILTGDHTRFLGTYQFDSGQNVTFETTSLNGNDALVIDNGTTVSFNISGGPTFAFGNLTDVGNGLGILDITYVPTDDCTNTVVFNETSSTFGGTLTDSAHNSRFVINGGTLDWTSYSSGDVDFIGTIINNGTLHLYSIVNIQGSLTNNGFIECVLLNVNGSLDNHGVVIAGAPDGVVSGIEYYTTGVINIYGTVINESGAYLGVGDVVYYSGFVAYYDNSSETYLNIENADSSLYNYGDIEVGGNITVYYASTFYNDPSSALNYTGDYTVT